MVTLEIEAPTTLKLFSQMQDSLSFIRELRMLGHRIVGKPNHQIWIDMHKVKEINYATISILKAVLYDFDTRNIAVVGNLPQDEKCNHYLQDCNYLLGLKDMRGRPFSPRPESAHILFKAGKGPLTQEQNLKISDMLADGLAFLGGDNLHELKLKTLLLEGCANSIEWGQTEGGQWMLGLKKEDAAGVRSLLFTITDVGKGILATLRRRLTDKILNFVNFQTEHEILRLAFERKWGSRTGEINRNNGLPTFRRACELGMIDDLRVLTNNVILRFSGADIDARTLPPGFPRFSGTIYQWSVSTNSLINMSEAREYAYH